MDKLKDFLYDKNDVLIALLVLVAAALIIIWRMDAIMEYPEKMLADDGVSSSQVSDGDGSGDAQDGEGSSGDDSQSGADSQGGADDSDSSQGGQDGEGQDDGSQAPAGTDLWMSGILTRDVEVDVYGNSATAAINCLVDAGLFEDYAEYQKICDESGLNHEKVSAGSLIFEKGSNKYDVARKVNWS